MGYTILCTNNPCGSVVGRWYVESMWESMWVKTKPKANQCVSINSAFRSKEKEEKYHNGCACVFEVVEIGE